MRFGPRRRSVLPCLFPAFQCCRFAFLAFFAFAQHPAFGQERPPISDPVEQPQIPSGISDFDIALNARLVSMSPSEDGFQILHFLEGFELKMGHPDTQTLRSREAVVWLGQGEVDGKPVSQLQIFLWKDAEVVELGGTLTLSPALFVTANTFGKVTVHSDHVIDRPPAESQAYREGERIRQVITKDGWIGGTEPATFGVFDPTGTGVSGSARLAPKPIIQFQTSGELSVNETSEGGRVITVTGGVYLSRGTAKSGEYLETLAENAVVFLAPGQELKLPKADSKVGLGADQENAAPDGSAAPKKSRSPNAADRQLLSSGFGDVEVEGVYLEGDVQFTQGPHMIRASRLYYDFLRDRALILDAVVRTLLVERNVPLYIRAAEIRQLSTNQFAADNALITTSEFHTPHYHVGARRVELSNTTPQDLRGRAAGITSGVFRIEDPTLNLSGSPVLWWPFIKGNVDSSETAIRSMRTGYSDDWGFELETNWHLFNLLGLETPEGFDSTLSLDYYSERGPGIGIDANYERDTYFGLFKSYLIYDEGVDSLGQDREIPPPNDLRGRLLVRHRHYLEDDWQLSLELSYISDQNFLEEYFEPEFDNGKEQETLLYLKKQQDNWAFTTLLQVRLMDFLTQTERYPDLAYFKIGEPIGDRLTWYTENRLGMVRYSADDDQDFWDWLQYGPAKSSGPTGRADTRQEIDSPFDLGPMRFVPFATGRATGWTDTPDLGGTGRGFGLLGVRGTMYLSKIYPDWRSDVFDINGMRHIIKPEIVAWASAANRDRNDLYQFDQTVEGIDDTSGVSLGVRQRWQTKRGEGENFRNVDVFLLDIKAAVFDNSNGDYTTNGFASYSRPENSISRNYVNAAAAWRVNDRTSVLSELNYDLNNTEIDILNVSLAVERTPRLSYLIGYRFIEESESNLLGFDLNYKVTEKHSIALRESFDLDRGETLDFTIALVRKHPRWFSALSFELDESEDDFGISLSIWPEGLPQAALGSRRFTGLAQTTRLQND